MIKINPVYIQRVQQANALEDLFDLVQKAIELEHSTIPPYLTAMFSLVPNTNSDTWGIIHSVVLEEMLHMTIAANILNALGGSPQINTPSFVPAYPGPLVMGIGGDLIVGLAAYSIDVVENTFMRIEEPEHPLVFKAALADEQYATIGAFYVALGEKINELVPDAMPGDPARQVTSPYFDSSVLFEIKTKTDATNAIAIIMEQGEGTSVSPLDQGQDLAHYYRFEELVRGHCLVKDPSAPNGFSFTGAAISFDPANVYPLFPNTKTAMLPDGSKERQAMDAFNTSYALLLNGLHTTFNGQPSKLNDTISTMRAITSQAQTLCSMPFPGKDGYNIGPSFEFISTPVIA